MVSILLCGAGGKMGQVITQAVAQRSDCRIAAGIDPHAPACDYPVYASADQCTEPCDVIIDFSHPSALSPLLEYAISHRLPAVICTTGLSEEQIESIHQAARQIPIFFSANMSLGVSLLCELAKKAAQVLGSDFDIEIIEKHHNRKVDAPSGTALMLADAISCALPQQPQYIYDRHSRRAPRSREEIGIHSVRGGTIVGEHEILFAGHDEQISLTHTAASKEILPPVPSMQRFSWQIRKPGFTIWGIWFRIKAKPTKGDFFHERRQQTLCDRGHLSGQL